METEDNLAWEARQRPRAALAAIAASALTLAGGIFSGITFSDVPRAGLAPSLQRALEPGDLGGEPSLRLALYEFYDENVGSFIGAALLSALGALAAGAALSYLAMAVLSRRQEFPRAGLYLPAVGAGLFAVSLILVAIGTGATVDQVLDGDRTVNAVGDIAGSSLLVTGQLIEVVARFILGAAFVLVSLNAMRTGLLTRFMGVLGIISGVLLALPVFGGPLPIVQCFWLGALGLIIAGRWPSGVPPAWRTGRAEPWPSGAEMRQQRRAEIEARRGGGAAEAEPAPAGDPVAEAEAITRAHPVSKKRKRKRRS